MFSLSLSVTFIFTLKKVLKVGRLNKQASKESTKVKRTSFFQESSLCKEQEIERAIELNFSLFFQILELNKKKKKFAFELMHN